MKIKTRNGIYNDLKKSEYTYNYMGFVFYFSSKLHLDNFKQRLPDKIDSLEESLKKRFDIAFYVPQLAAILLYYKIESRGKYYTFGGKEVKCLSDLALNGAMMTKKSCRDLTKTLKQNETGY